VLHFAKIFDIFLYDVDFDLPWGFQFCMVLLRIQSETDILIKLDSYTFYIITEVNTILKENVLLSYNRPAALVECSYFCHTLVAKNVHK